MAIESGTALQELAAEGIEVDLYDARFAKPIDSALLRTLVSKGIPILTVEDHSIRGGFGSCVLEACNEHGLDARQIHRLAMPDSWVYQAERSEQLAEVGLDASSIASKVRALISAPMREFTNA